MLSELRDVTVSYRRGRHRFTAVSGVSLTVAPGERVALVGGSGAGKTTVVRAMLGLVPPSAGEVLFAGLPVAGPRGVEELRRRAAMVFQDPASSLNPRLRVRDIVAEPLRSPLRPAPDDVGARVGQVLTGVGLDAAMGERYPHQLSGGQRQRVAIARALVSEPDLLVADEPVSALDVAVRAQVLDLLHATVEERDLALVLVTHDLAVARGLCDRVVVVHEGQVAESGPTKQVLGDPRHPATRHLVDAALEL